MNFAIKIRLVGESPQAPARSRTVMRKSKRRTKQICVRLTDEELQAINALVERTPYSRETFLQPVPSSARTFRQTIRESCGNCGGSGAMWISCLSKRGRSALWMKCRSGASKSRSTGWMSYSGSRSEIGRGDAKHGGNEHLGSPRGQCCNRYEVYRQSGQKHLRT